jgi:hypothetical protein
MAGPAGARRVVDSVGKAGYELAFDDNFDRDALDETRWLPYYLPKWSSREAAAARYQIGGGVLRLVIEADQQPWCPEFDGGIRASSLQTGVFAGPVGHQDGRAIPRLSHAVHAQHVRVPRRRAVDPTVASVPEAVHRRLFRDYRPTARRQSAPGP